MNRNMASMSAFISFTNKAPCCIGAVAFLVDKATKGSHAFDPTTGIVTDWVIPQ